MAFNQYNGLKLPIIPYRGTAPAANDVVGGHVPMMIEAILSLLQLVRGGSVRAVAVTSKKRSSLAPEIPTMTELGLPALNFGAWWGMWGPPGLPAELTNTINGLVNAAVKELGAEGRLAALGIEPYDRKPAVLRQVHRRGPRAQRQAAEGRELPAGVRSAGVCIYFGFAAACATAATLARCSSIAAANSAALPGRMVAPVGCSRSATAGSVAIARTSAAMRAFRLSGMSRQP